MKKKIGLIVGMAVATLLLTGCDGTVTREIRHAGFSLSSDEFVCSTLMPANEETPPTDNILYTDGSYAITDDGKLYELSLSQPYSNEENCKRISFSIDIIAYMDGTILKGDDGKFYYATENNVVVRNTQFISGKAINMYKSIILRRYPSAKFWEKPIPAVYFKDCWLVGEVKLMPDDCMLLLELVSGQVQAVEQSSFWQFGGLASPENTNFSWK